MADVENNVPNFDVINTEIDLMVRMSPASQQNFVILRTQFGYDDSETELFVSKLLALGKVVSDHVVAGGTVTLDGLGVPGDQLTNIHKP